jgi:hypothetical protein
MAGGDKPGMTYGDGHERDPLQVRRHLRRPDNVDSAPASGETWPAMPAPPAAPVPPLSRAQRDQTAAALNWPTLKWFTQRQSAGRRPVPPPARAPVPAFEQRPNAEPKTAWVSDYATEVFPCPPVPPPARGAAAVAAAGAPVTAPARPGNRRRRTVVVAGAAVAALIGIGGVGFMDFVAGDGGQGSPVGLPLIPAPSSRGALPSSPAGSAPAPASPTLSLPPGARPATTDAAGVAPATGGTTTVVPPEGSPIASTAPASPPPPGEARAFAPPSPFGPSPTGADAASTGAVTGPGGLCLAAPGARAQTATCDGGADQRWTVGTDGTLRVSGNCADGGGDSVAIVACGAAATSRWRAGSNRSVVNAGTGECLTDPIGGARAGTAVTITACTGGSDQRWSLP